MLDASLRAHDATHIITIVIAIGLVVQIVDAQIVF